MPSQARGEGTHVERFDDAAFRFDRTATIKIEVHDRHERMVDPVLILGVDHRPAARPAQDVCVGRTIAQQAKQRDLIEAMGAGLLQRSLLIGSRAES